MINETESLPAEKNKETGRVEAFSDGVFAITITLLVLKIQVPHDLPMGKSLAGALIDQWPTYLAFVTSFEEPTTAALVVQYASTPAKATAFVYAAPWVRGDREHGKQARYRLRVSDRRRIADKPAGTPLGSNRG